MTLFVCDNGKMSSKLLLFAKHAKERQTYRQRDKQTDRPTDRQKYCSFPKHAPLKIRIQKQTNEQIDRQKDKQKDKETDRAFDVSQNTPFTKRRRNSNCFKGQKRKKESVKERE